MFDLFHFLVSLQSVFNSKLKLVMPIKNLVILFILAITCPILTAQTPSPIKTRSVEFTTTIAYVTIDGMACQEGCADVIAANLVKTKGIQSAEVSYSNSMAIITFDDTRIKIKEIETIITTTKVKDYVYAIKNKVLKNQIVR